MIILMQLIVLRVLILWVNVFHLKASKKQHLGPYLYLNHFDSSNVLKNIRIVEKPDERTINDRTYHRHTRQLKKRSILKFNTTQIELNCDVVMYNEPTKFELCPKPMGRLESPNKMKMHTWPPVITKTSFFSGLPPPHPERWRRRRFPSPSGSSRRRQGVRFSSPRLRHPSSAVRWVCAPAASACLPLSSRPPTPTPNPRPGTRRAGMRRSGWRGVLCSGAWTWPISPTPKSVAFVGLIYYNDNNPSSYF